MTPDDIQNLGKDNVDKAMASLGDWTRSAQAIAAEFADYSKKSFEGSAAVWEKLMGAKSLEKAIEIQSQYLKSSFDDFVAEAEKLGDLYNGLAKEMYKPFEGALAKVAMK